MVAIEWAGRWPLDDDAYPWIHDDDCEGRRAWLDRDVDELEGLSIHDFPCRCGSRELSWVLAEAKGAKHWIADDVLDVRWRAYRARAESLADYCEAKALGRLTKTGATD